FDQSFLACREGTTRIETTRSAYYLASRIDRVGNAARIAIHIPECRQHAASPEEGHECLIPSYGGGTSNFSGIINPTRPSVGSSQCPQVIDCSSIPKKGMRRHVSHNSRLTDNLTAVVEPIGESAASPKRT